MFSNILLECYQSSRLNSNPVNYIYWSSNLFNDYPTAPLNAYIVEASRFFMYCLSSYLRDSHAVPYQNLNYGKPTLQTNNHYSNIFDPNVLEIMNMLWLSLTLKREQWKPYWCFLNFHRVCFWFTLWPKTNQKNPLPTIC